MKVLLFKEKKFKLQILWLIVKFITCVNFQCAKLFGQRHAKMSVKKKEKLQGQKLFPGPGLT